MITPKIEKLIVKYITNSAAADDLDTLSKWIEHPENRSVFKDYVQTHYAITYSMNEPESEKTLERLLRTIRKEKTLIYKLRTQPIFKYAAAAILIITLASTYLLRDTVFNNQIFDNAPIIVNSQIEPGVDKATLTLEDGTQISLEEGTPYQHQNVSSNGKEIIYSSQLTTNNQQPTTNILTIPRGGQFQLTLADGTLVWLNSETQLKYPVTFINGESRQVELVYGEAYFDVSPSIEHNGANFRVLHKQQEIKVLGTEFNIKAYSDELNIYTTLAEGKVAINYLGKTQNLIPGQQSQVNTLTNTLNVATVNIKTEVSWKDGIFSFKEKSLKEIMASLSRWYDVDVVFKNKSLENVKFNGVLRKHQNIEEILAVIMSNSINTYEINNKTIILK